MEGIPMEEEGAVTDRNQIVTTDRDHRDRNQIVTEDTGQGINLMDNSNTDSLTDSGMDTTDRDHNRTVTALQAAETEIVIGSLIINNRNLLFLFFCPLSLTYHKKRCASLCQEEC
jgi:hypothetical protein